MHPDPKLTQWIVKHPESAYHMSVLTLGEIQAGIAKLDVADSNQNRQRMILEDWLFGDLVLQFSNRILDVMPQVAFTWGRMSGNGMRMGNPVPIAD